MKEEEESRLMQFPHYWGNTPEEDYYNLQGIKSSKSFYTSPRGVKLFTRQWLPISHPPRGIIFMVHGYGNDISWTFQATPIFLAQNGFACFACFALDLQAHGQSHGLRAFVPNVDLVVQDCIFFFNFIKQNPQFQNLPSFLYSESMGGAICLLNLGKNPIWYPNYGEMYVLVPTNFFYSKWYLNYCIVTQNGTSIVKSGTILGNSQ